MMDSGTTAPSCRCRFARRTPTRPTWWASTHLRCSQPGNRRPPSRTSSGPALGQRWIWVAGPCPGSPSSPTGPWRPTRRKGPVRRRLRHSDTVLQGRLAGLGLDVDQHHAAIAGRNRRRTMGQRRLGHRHQRIDELSDAVVRVRRPGKRFRGTAFRGCRPDLERGAGPRRAANTSAPSSGDSRARVTKEPSSSQPHVAYRASGSGRSTERRPATTRSSCAAVACWAHSTN